MTYKSKAEKFAELLRQAVKVEAAAQYYTEQGHAKIGNDLAKKARELYAAANAYSIRWGVL